MTDAAALVARIQALEDVAAIKDVQYAYWHALDLKRPDDLRSVFAPGKICIRFPGAPDIVDREDMIGMVKEHGMSPTYQGNHFGLSPRLRLTGPENAAGTWRVHMIEYQFDKRTAMNMTSMYDCEYVRTPDGWRISSTIVTPHSVYTNSIDASGGVTAPNYGPL